MNIGYSKHINLHGIFIAIILLLLIDKSFAQSAKDYIRIKKMYKGTWYNKQTKRHITISFDEESEYVTINDWTGKRNASSIDSYKAFIKDNKLVLYAENDDHHSPYCEMEIVEQQLVYECNEPFNFKDQFLNREKQMDKSIYKRLKE
ncbi:MAG: hypothetical protein ABI402_17975 [Ferruginibacter sp.]